MDGVSYYNSVHHVHAIERTLCFSLSSGSALAYDVDRSCGCGRGGVVWYTLRKRCAHDHTAHGGGSGEVSLAALSPAGVRLAVDLRHVGGGR